MTLSEAQKIALLVNILGEGRDAFLIPATVEILKSWFPDFIWRGDRGKVTVQSPVHPRQGIAPQDTRSPERRLADKEGRGSK